MTSKWHGGKGDRRRTKANDDAYRSGWDRIFDNDGKVKENGKEKGR